MEFWDSVTEDYLLDMSPLKALARDSLTKRTFEVTVRSKNVMAGAAKIQHFDIETMKTEDLKVVQV